MKIAKQGGVWYNRGVSGKGYDIRYEDEELIVVHKQAGIAVQTRSVGQADLESEIRRYLLGERKSGGMGSVYLGIVHRLDQPVEGLLVLAKTPEAAAALSKQAGSAGGMEKEYRAVVYGHMPEAAGTLVDDLEKDGRTNTTRVVAEGAGKRAVLSYERSERTEETETLRIRLDTGRHHQIRVQLAHAGCPVLGDNKYGTEASIAYAGRQGIRQLQLFAEHLAFWHPRSGERMEFYMWEAAVE